MSAIRILEVIIKDFKKLKDLKSNIEGCNVFLRGPNRVGKSSFMDFIEIALGKSKIVPPDTNIEGQVITDKDGMEYRFEVKLDPKGKPKVTVIMPDGSKDTSKSVIAGIVGLNSFDIDEFVNLSTTDAGRKKQVEEFKKFLDEETRTFLSKYEVSIKKDFDERTDINRDIKKLEGSVNLHPMINHIHEIDSFTEVNTELALNELKEIQKHNETVNKVLGNIETRKTEIEKHNADIKELEEKILAIKKEVATKEDLTKQANDWLKTNAIKPTEALEKSITDASETNKKHSQAKDLIKQLGELKVLRETEEVLTKKIDSEREMIKDAIREMKGPVQGLGFDDEQLLYNGIPVHPQSLSKSEIKKLGIQLKIAENPDLPLFIHEAECMDEDSLREIQNLADECGLQMFAEEVQRGGPKDLQIEIVAFS
jgi:hypothetical protein